MRKPKGVLTLLVIMLIFSVIGLVFLGGYIMMSVRGTFGMVLGLLVWLAATDLICAVCGKTLIKPGPIAESMYPLLKKGRKGDEFS